MATTKDVDVGSDEWLDLISELQNRLYSFLPQLQKELKDWISIGMWDGWDSVVKIQMAVTHLAHVCRNEGLVAFRNAVKTLNATMALSLIDNSPYAWAFRS